eukprot:7320627-Karenia_brevis.AAC.1
MSLVEVDQDLPFLAHSEDDESKAIGLRWVHWVDWSINHDSGTVRLAIGRWVKVNLQSRYIDYVPP